MTQAERINELVRTLEAIADPAARAAATELVQTVMEIHASGVERLLEIISNDGEAGARIAERIGRDDITGGLLALHGLHPVDLRTRIAGAIEAIRPSLIKRHSELEMLNVADGHVQLRLSTNGNGCGSSAGVRELIENAVYTAAPDLVSLTIDGAQASAPGFVPLEVLGSCTTR